MTNYTDQDSDRATSDREYDRWEASWEKIRDFRVINEIFGDLFAQPKDYSLAHCVAEDLRMGSGIAVDFKQEFKNLPMLLDQRARQGGLATLHDPKNNRFVYYLVTKRESNGKPTYLTLWRSLTKMRDHMRQHEVKKLAIPRLGCGLDRLEWDRVKSMIEYLFTEADVDITVCNWQQEEEVPKKFHTCRLVVEDDHITNIAAGTLIVYFSTENMDVDDNMSEMAKKFNFLPNFRRQKSKRMGEVVYSEDGSYGLLGCIVRRNNRENISFSSLAKCMQEFNKMNSKYKNDAFEYVAFQWVKESDYRDDLINQKIITVLINILRHVYVHVRRDGVDGNRE